MINIPRYKSLIKDVENLEKQRKEERKEREYQQALNTKKVSEEDVNGILDRYPKIIVEKTSREGDGYSS